MIDVQIVNLKCFTLKMKKEENQMHFHHLSFTSGMLKKKKMICAIYGASFARCTVCNLLNSEVEILNTESYCRPAVIDDQIQMLTKNNPSHMTCDIAGILYV